MKLTPPYNRPSLPDDTAAMEAAINRHEERLARDPTSLVFAQLADLYRKIGRTRQAVSLCREGLVRYPQYTTARLILVKTLMGEEAFDAALGELAPLIESAPKDAQVQRLAAELQRRLGNIDGALHHLEIAARLDPTDRESRALLGLLRADPSTSGEASGLARVLNDDTFTTLTFGTLCLEQGCAEEAAIVFTRILRRDPDHAGAREGLESALRARPRRRG